MTMVSTMSPSDIHGGHRIVVHDDNLISYGPGGSAQVTDWKEKYYEASDMLSEARAELDDFQHSSKELEEELERELDRTEKVQQELKVKVSVAESQCSEWKNKFISLQTTYNTTTASLQRELDNLRKDHQQLKVQLRELEMGNDDLERNERAVTSSLADIEGKYSRALEEKILLEHELLDKASMEEESQRLKDELRDAGLEINVLNEQLEQAQAQISQLSQQSLAASQTSLSTENLRRHRRLPSRPQLPNLMEGQRAASPVSMSGSSTSQTLDADATIRQHLQPSSPTRAHRLPPIPSDAVGPTPIGAKANARLPNVPSLLNQSSSSTLRSTPRFPLIDRPPNQRSGSISVSTHSSESGTAPRSKGVQMVYEMRARVRNLEQKLTARGPRIRTGSFLSRNNSMKNTAASSVSSVANAIRLSRSSTDSSKTNSTKASISSKTSSPKGSLELPDLNERLKQNGMNGNGRTSLEMTINTPTAKSGTGAAGDTSGWVLIMDDATTPSPLKDKERPRSLSSYESPMTRNFRSSVAVSNNSPSQQQYSPSTRNLTAQNLKHASMPSGIRPPSQLGQARRLSVSTDVSSGRATPTLLPVPVRASSPGQLAASSSGKISNGAARTQKRSSLSASTNGGPGSQKRSSLGSSTATVKPSTSTSSSSFLAAPEYGASRPLSVQSDRPDLSRSTAHRPLNASIRPTGGSSALKGGAGGVGNNKNAGLAQSRIGRPVSIGSSPGSAPGSRVGSRLGNGATGNNSNSPNGRWS